MPDLDPHGRFLISNDGAERRKPRKGTNEFGDAMVGNLT
jgi:hypothetical protein